MIFGDKMIYLTNTTTAQAVFIPRDSDIAGTGTLTFSAQSTVDLETAISATVLDLEISEQYYRVALTLNEDTQPGEYEYTLAQAGTTVSEGVLVVGEYVSTPTEYDKTITYEQYNAE